jgi:hypothetical protein
LKVAFEAQPKPILEKACPSTLFGLNLKHHTAPAHPSAHTTTTTTIIFIITMMKASIP